MIWCESDKKLLESIATLWVDSGGDAEGLDWNYSNLKELIQAEVSRRVVEKENNYE